MGSPGFWEDRKRAEGVTRDVSTEKGWIRAIEEIRASLRDAGELLDLGREAGDDSLGEEIGKMLETASRRVDDLERRSLLGEEDDPRNAIVTIHSGAGGTDSQDWAEMLLRMYLRWIERRGFASEVLDLQTGDEAGIKGATIDVQGAYAFGYLKSEIGVHRLVRISPFDANHRRHTAFASAYVLPEREDDIAVDVKDADLRVDTFRASGAGGQHVNKTSSAIRITHLPTGIVVQCQTERSQHRNRASAMKVLHARLYEHYRRLEDAKQEEKAVEKKEIDFGSQIRSYVLHPYTMVKDLRTGAETSNVQAVLDGDIDLFIDAFLRARLAAGK
jgi:peptide chain release factor 2